MRKGLGVKIKGYCRLAAAICPARCVGSTALIRRYDLVR
jgi:hypothetical protein